MIPLVNTKLTQNAVSKKVEVEQFQIFSFKPVFKSYRIVNYPFCL
jgi:hypothetical protein